MAVFPINTYIIPMLYVLQEKPVKMKRKSRQKFGAVLRLLMKIYNERIYELRN